MNLPNSDFKFGVYSTDGEILKGSLSEYGSLSQRLNPKRCAFYIETNLTNVLIGTRLIVQIKGGREERAIFFAQYPNTFCKDDPEWICHFFDSAKQEVESLDSIQYTVLGVWDSGDLNSIHVKTEKNNLLDVLLGRLLNNEKTTVKIQDFSSGICLLEQIISSLCNISPLRFVYAISHYPLGDGSDLLLIPDGMKTDIEPNKNNEYVIVNPEIETMKTFYRAFFLIFSQLKNSQNPSSRDELAITIREKIVDSKCDLSEIYKKSPEKIVKFFQNDPKRLVIICNNIFVATGNLKDIDRDTLSTVYIQVGRQSDTADSMRDFLISIYQQLDDPNKERFINSFQKSRFIWEFPLLFQDVVAFMIRNKRWEFFSYFNEDLQSTQITDKFSKWISDCFSLKNFTKQELDEFVLYLDKLQGDLNSTKEFFLNNLNKYYKIKKYKSEILEKLDRPKSIVTPSGGGTPKPAVPKAKQSISDGTGERKSDSSDPFNKYFIGILIAIILLCVIGAFYFGIFQNITQATPPPLTLRLFDKTNGQVLKYTIFVDLNSFDYVSIKSENKSITTAELNEKFWNPSITEADLSDGKTGIFKIEKPSDPISREIYLPEKIREYIRQSFQKK
ncbi:MAG: hypothetical protein Q7U51_13260 [Methanoregula sp.]|nr:hypothetical protein [Methanoregula sp.]